MKNIRKFSIIGIVVLMFFLQLPMQKHALAQGHPGLSECNLFRQKWLQSFFTGDAGHRVFFHVENDGIRAGGSNFTLQFPLLLDQENRVCLTDTDATNFFTAYERQIRKDLQPIPVRTKTTLTCFAESDIEDFAKTQKGKLEYLPDTIGFAYLGSNSEINISLYHARKDGNNNVCILPEDIVRFARDFPKLNSNGNVDFYPET